jgi:hypothetical protein
MLRPPGRCYKCLTLCYKIYIGLSGPEVCKFAELFPHDRVLPWRSWDRFSGVQQNTDGNAGRAPKDHVDDEQAVHARDQRTADDEHHGQRRTFKRRYEIAAIGFKSETCGKPADGWTGGAEGSAGGMAAGCNGCSGAGGGCPCSISGRGCSGGEIIGPPGAPLIMSIERRLNMKKPPIVSSGVHRNIKSETGEGQPKLQRASIAALISSKDISGSMKPVSSQSSCLVGWRTKAILLTFIAGWFGADNPKRALILCSPRHRRHE